MSALRRAIIVGVPMLCSGLHAVGAQRVGRASQVITFRVIAVSHVAVSGGASLLRPQATRVSASIAPRILPGGTYGITTNQDGNKIVLSLDRDLPADFSMAAGLTAPDGALSEGPQTLATVGRDAVSGIPVSSQTGLPISYTLVRAAGAQESRELERTVWMTIISGI